jgi:hypothetical protein
MPANDLKTRPLDVEHRGVLQTFHKAATAFQQWLPPDDEFAIALDISLLSQRDELLLEVHLHEDMPSGTHSHGLPCGTGPEHLHLICRDLVKWRNLQMLRVDGFRLVPRHREEKIHVHGICRAVACRRFVRARLALRFRGLASRHHRAAERRHEAAP